MRTLSTRLIWPAPMPTVAPPRAKTMAFDLTCFATVSANNRSAISAFGRGAFCDHRQAVAGRRDPVALLDQQAPGKFMRCPALGRRVGQRAGHQEPQRLLAGEYRARRVVGFGSDDDLDKNLCDRLGGRGVERTVQRHDAAKRADRIADERLVPGLAQAGAGGGAARIGVLDDRDGRVGELGDQLIGGVGIGIVVVGQLLALDLAGGRDARDGYRRCDTAPRADAGFRRSGSARRAARSRPAFPGRSLPRRARTTARPRRHRRRSARKPCAPDAAAAHGRPRRC